MEKLNVAFNFQGHFTVRSISDDIAVTLEKLMEKMSSHNVDSYREFKNYVYLK